MLGEKDDITQPNGRYLDKPWHLIATDESRNKIGCGESNCEVFIHDRFGFNAIEMYDVANNKYPANERAAH